MPQGVAQADGVVSCRGSARRPPGGPCPTGGGGACLTWAGRWRLTPPTGPPTRSTANHELGILGLAPSTLWAPNIDHWYSPPCFRRQVSLICADASCCVGGS